MLRRLRPVSIDLATFDEVQDWIESLDPQPWMKSEMPSIVVLPDRGAHVDMLAGEFFCSTWRRRLADAQGDYGHVARQMRKAGVPLDLALAILLNAEQLPPWMSTSIAPAALPSAAVWPGQDAWFDRPDRRAVLAAI